MGSNTNQRPPSLLSTLPYSPTIGLLYSPDPRDKSTETATVAPSILHDVIILLSGGATQSKKVHVTELPVWLTVLLAADMHF